MKKITVQLNIYRECARNLWNVYFLDLVPEKEAWDIQDEFEKICTMLFSSLVLNPLGLSSFNKSYSYEQYPEPIDALHVVPITTEVPININREKKCSGYWDHPIKTISPDDVDLRFIDLFDFDKMGFREFEYYRVRIVDSSASQELVGRDALLRCSYVNIFM